MDRKTELLTAALELLEEIAESNHDSALTLTAFYDDTDCTGYCLMIDIRDALQETADE